MEMLKDVETVMAARTVQGVWRHYVDRLSALGFSHVCYFAQSALDESDRCGVDDGTFLSNYPPRLLQQIRSQRTLSNLPMYRWLGRGPGCESWDWMQGRRRAGLLGPAEARMLELFARHGHVSGYAIDLGDSVPQVRAGVVLSGALGMRQDRLDELWRRHRAVVMALTGLLHLRLATLPYAASQSLLTLRQREVLEYISAGRTMQEIATLLDLTPATVEKHLRLARKALGARTTAQAILLATSRRQILVQPGDPAGRDHESREPAPEMVPEPGGLAGDA